jgi:diketogulonate reductase-like aldo/keto reductase
MAVGRVLTDPAIAEIAESRGRSISQVVLRWLVQREGVVGQYIFVAFVVIMPRSMNFCRRVLRMFGATSLVLFVASVATLSALADFDAVVSDHFRIPHLT